MVKRILILTVILLGLANPVFAQDSAAPQQAAGVWYVLDAGGDVQYAVLGGESGGIKAGMSFRTDGTQIAVEDGYVRLFNEMMGSLYIEADSRVELGEKVIVYSGVAYMNSATGRSFQFGIPTVAPMSDMRGGAAVIERDISMFCLHPASSANTLSEESAAMFEAIDDYACWQMKDGLWEPATPPEAVRNSQRRFSTQALDSIKINFERLPSMQDTGGEEENSGGAVHLGTGASSGGEASSGGGQSMCLDSGSNSGASGDINNGGNDVSIERGKTRVNVKVKLEE